MTAPAQPAAAALPLVKNLPVAATAREFGIATYVIQEKDLTEEKFRTAFSLSVFIAAFVMILLMALSRPIANFYGEPGLANVLIVLALSLLVIPFNALSLAMLRQLLLTCDRTARGRRDRALLLFGFAGALRRSELVSLRVEDVVVDANGLRLRILRGKTDQEGRFNFAQLPPGAYSVKAEADGFEPQQNDNLVSALGQKQTQHLRLRARTLVFIQPAPVSRRQHWRIGSTIGLHQIINWLIR